MPENHVLLQKRHSSPHCLPPPPQHLRCPIWASGTRSRMMRQASYTMVEGSNCIVFTTLPMLILSDRATMLAAEESPRPVHLLNVETCGQTSGREARRSQRFSQHQGCRWATCQEPALTAVPSPAPPRPPAARLAPGPPLPGHRSSLKAPPCPAEQTGRQQPLGQLQLVRRSRSGRKG